MIQTNEIILKENDTWLHFAEPHRIISIHDVKDVLPALREIEDLIDRMEWHAAGFLSYECSPAFDQAHQTHPGAGFPVLWFGLYPEPRPFELPGPDSEFPALTWSPSVPQDEYNTSINKIRTQIAEGLTYQVNYTMRLDTAFEEDPWGYFLHFARAQNKHAAYVDTGRYVICSASPELFFDLDGDVITCRPMKGTVKRGRTTAEDQAQAQWLMESEKNRAENVMIVDMIRNDLGRIARIGSVRVPQLFALEKYPSLWQMTSTVQATTTASLAGIFSALFPCASITGAPKVSTMRIISELETTPRNIYTGSIGHIAPDRQATFNVAIRTVLIDRETRMAEYGVGGGIVWDSTSADEYREALLKAQVLTETQPQFCLMETLLWTPEEGFFLREKHISRLIDSAKYFEFSMSRTDPAISKKVVETYLLEISSHFNSPQRVRLLLDKHGKLSHEVRQIQSTREQAQVKTSLARQPIDSGNVFLFHKTTHRDTYDAARRDFPDFDDVLLYNEHRELTEFTIGNLVVKMGGRFYTPPITCGLLPGTFRAHLLESGQVQERIIRVEELKDCSETYLVNSVRKWQKVVLVTK